MSVAYEGRPCLCGCGKLLPPSTNRRPRSFIQGHNPKHRGPRKDSKLCYKVACQRLHAPFLSLCGTHQREWEQYKLKHPNADGEKWRRYPGRDYLRDWRKKNW